MTTTRTLILTSTDISESPIVGPDYVDYRFFTDLTLDETKFRTFTLTEFLAGEYSNASAGGYEASIVISGTETYLGHFLQFANNLYANAVASETPLLTLDPGDTAGSDGIYIIRLRNVDLYTMQETMNPIGGYDFLKNEEVNVFYPMFNNLNPAVGTGNLTILNPYSPIAYELHGSIQGLRLKSGAYVNFPSLLRYGLPMSPIWTCFCWFRTAVTNANQALLSWTREDNVGGMKMFISSTGVISFWGAESAPGYNDGNWHLIVIDSTGKMLIDTVLVEGTTYVAPLAPNAFLGRCTFRKDDAIQLLSTIRTYNTPDGIDAPEGIRPSEGVVGTITAATFEGRSGLAWDLNSLDPRYFDLHNHNQYTMLDGTWFLWFNPATTASSGTLLYYKDKQVSEEGSGVSFLQYEKVSGTTFRLRLYMYNSTQEVFSGTHNLLNADSGTNWHHVVLTYSATAMRLYLDGNLEHTFSSGYVTMNAYDKANNTDAKDQRVIRIGQNNLWNRDSIRYTDNTGVDSGTLGYDAIVLNGYTTYTQDGRTGYYNLQNMLFDLSAHVSSAFFNGNSFSVSYWYNSATMNDNIMEVNDREYIAFMMRESASDSDRFSVVHQWSNGNHNLRIKLTSANETGVLDWAVRINTSVDTNHNVWNHVAVVLGYDGPNYVFKVYRNGIAYDMGAILSPSEFTIANTIAGECDVAYVGGFGSGSFRIMKAAMSDFRAYNRVLTEGEIYNLANDMEIQTAHDGFQGHTYNIQFVTQEVNDTDAANLYFDTEVRNFDGNVAECGFFDRLLTEGESTSLYTKLSEFETVAGAGGTVGEFQAKFTVTES